MPSISLQVGDCLDLTRTMPDRSVDLCLCSPPYESQRSYDELGFNLSGQAWVDWAVERLVDQYRVCRGLTCWIVAGSTKKFRWSATPALLMAELHRAGVKLRSPAFFHRIGIPGSGGPDWLRGDVEFAICASHGRLPWSDNTAMGHPPKYPPGGAPSHRTTATRGSRAGDTRVMGAVYKPPEKANPGNVIHEKPSEQDLMRFIENYSHATKRSVSEVLWELQQAARAKAADKWIVGAALQFQGSQILQSSLYGGSTSHATNQGEGGGQGQVSREADQAKDCMREVREREPAPCSPQGRESDEQRDRQPSMPLSLLSSVCTQEIEGARLPGVWQAESYRRALQEALLPIQTAWRSAAEVFRHETADCFQSGELISCKVGKGHMGSDIAHENSAPYPESLAEFFVRSFCPPGGFVLDPFSGGGTTGVVAYKNGRNFIGFEMRESQHNLLLRRIAEYEQQIPHKDAKPCA